MKDMVTGSSAQQLKLEDLPIASSRLTFAASTAPQRAVV